MLGEYVQVLYDRRQTVIFGCRDGSLSMVHDARFERQSQEVSQHWKVALSGLHNLFGGFPDSRMNASQHFEQTMLLSDVNTWVTFAIGCKAAFREK